MKQKLTLDHPAIYRIEVQGHLEDHWSDWLDGLNIETQVDPQGMRVTRLTGTIIDQAALHGLLRKLYDLGMPLILVSCIEIKEE